MDVGVDQGEQLDADRASGDPVDAVAVVVEDAGASGRRLREVLADLVARAWPLDELIRRSACPRRSVEALLRAAGGDVRHDVDGYAIRPDRVALYQDRFGLGQLARTRLADPVGTALAGRAELVAQVAGDIAAAPAARESLDHVSATAETVARRALWLDGTFDLAGRRLLCVGDHDLTSLVVCAVNPDVAVTVVDIDERILQFIDQSALSRGLNVRCLYGDFRFGLPEGADGWADVVLTDPPYTPEGIQLFLARGLQGLRDRSGGRLVMAYGYSALVPALGVKAQRAVLDLDLAIEAVWPAFNRYQGAQAVGSASDMYVCQPTARTWKVLDRRLEQAGVNIYTHGEQSLEGERRQAAEADAAAARRTALGDLEERTPVIAVNGSPRDHRNVALGTVLAGGLPTQWSKRRPVVATADLSADPGPWLLRLLLAANADRMAVVVPDAHPDLRGQDARQALAELVALKYLLRFHRSAVSPGLTLVEADEVPLDGLDEGARLVRRLLDRAHGKVGNVWRDALMSLNRGGDAPLTKNQARALLREQASRPETLDARLIDLPRHQVRDLLAEVAASAMSGLAVGDVNQG